MNWQTALNSFMSSSKWTEIKEKVKKERELYTVYPSADLVMRALKECPLKSLRVVIFGQDPYHTPGTANGLAFSTDQEKRPPSLDVIFKEAYRDLEIKYTYNKSLNEYFQSNDLSGWAKAGFLLLNTVLTVQEGKPKSHEKIGWDAFIEEVIKVINAHAPRQVIFLLWGNNAKSLIPLIEKGPHIYFTAPHPAAEMYGGDKKFSGCGHFSLIRDIICAGMSTKNPDTEFDRKELERIVKEVYPESERILDYVDQGKILNKAVNNKKFNQNIRKFESIISTKPISNEQNN